MKKVSVIGAGVAGLASACRLQASGYEVTVYEKNAIPGGKMHQIKKDGYTYDVGPTLVMMPEVYEDVFKFANKNPEDYITMHRLEPMYSVYFDRETLAHYDVSSDLVKLNAMLEARRPQAAQGFYQYLSEIYKRYQVALNHFIRRPFRSYRDIYNPFMLKQAYKLKTFGSAEKMMNKYIKDRDIAQMFSFQTLYIGVSPQKGPSLYNIIPMIELLYGVWTIKGGMHAMARGMEQLLKDLGGSVKYNQTVEEILIDNKQTQGIKVNGQTIKSDYVVSNADFPYTMKHLIHDAKAKGKYTDKNIDNMDYSCSCLIFYWGMDKSYDLPMHTFIVSKDLDTNLKQIFNGEFIDDASIYLSIPSKGDSDMAPKDKDGFYVLIPVSELSTVKYAYDDTVIDAYKENALKKIERLPGCDNVRSEIVSESIYTPYDFKEKFNAYNGATFGLQPTLRQSNHWRPQAKSKTVEGLYFTGSSTHPGAGVPIVLESGKICAEELRRDEPSDGFT